VIPGVNGSAAGPDGPRGAGLADPAAGQAQPFDTVGVLFDRYVSMSPDRESGWQAWLTAHLSPPGTGGTAIDLGCGTGRNTVLLADRYDHVTGVDASHEMLAMAAGARDRPNIDWRQADLRPISTRRFGTHQLVLSVTTIHHLGPAELVLPEVRSLVAPGGLAILVDMIDPGGWTTRDFHIDRAFTEARTAWNQDQQRQDVTDVLALLLHPVWLDMVARDTPLTRDDFTRLYTEVFPGAVITQPHSLMAAAVWRNTDDPPVLAAIPCEHLGVGPRRSG
jgi:trans-aconitate methyltransferase